MFGMGFEEIAVIFILGIVIIGPKQLPQVARGIGRLLTHMRRLANEVRSSMHDHMQALEDMDEVKTFRQEMEAGVNEVGQTGKAMVDKELADTEQWLTEEDSEPRSIQSKKANKATAGKAAEATAQTKKAGKDAEATAQTKKAGKATEATAQTKKAGKDAEATAQTKKAGKATEATAQTKKAGKATEATAQTKKAGKDAEATAQTKKAGKAAEATVQTKKAGKAAEAIAQTKKANKATEATKRTAPRTLVS